MIVDEVKEQRVPIQIRFEWKLVLLILLSVFDAGTTDFGLRFGLIDEANPLMSYVYSYSIFAFYFIKLGLPFSLVAFHSFVAHSRVIHRLLSFCIILYAGIAVLHLYWLLAYFSFQDSLGFI
ncbi:DUF5658 family protein [Sporosarcina aquimarina]|uniref:DUF5658 family protein n=1 Tax=Sporosarcina aquimarina TaxID=114975 RepID=A0ABU4G1P7_9BACL|nr:DUF5658 family protein [Sporosarcina aquimarina]MDW0110243.1 DUF5658 family protein [Sporosarcina aquimarina]